MNKVQIFTKNNIRIYVSDVLELVNTALNVHDTFPLPSLVLGTAIAATSTFACMKKHDLSFHFKSEASIKSVIVDVRGNGDVKALISDPYVTTDVDGADINSIPLSVGLSNNGTLKVVNFENGTSYGSETELVSGDIVSDLAYYINQSEQIFSAIISDVKLDSKNVASAAKCVIFQLLPSHDDSDIEFVESFIKENQLSSMTLNEYIGKLDSNKIGEKILQWNCDFTEEKARSLLSSVSNHDKKELINKLGFIEVKDEFCKKSFKFGLDDKILK